MGRNGTTNQQQAIRTLGTLVAVLLSSLPSAAGASPVAALPNDLSIGGMFLQADWIVKLVILGLGFASLTTWTVFFAKSAQLRRLAQAQREVTAVIAGFRSLDQASAQPVTAAHPLVGEARAELELSADALVDGDGIKERVVSRFERFEAAEARRLTRGVNVLATIGATAPFVGLFGTVWGIMNAFVGIAEKQTTNLAVVAPGIAEALLATAIGLVAAIPAVVIYNHFARQTAGYKALVADTSSAVLRLVSRDLSRRATGMRKAA